MKTILFIAVLFITPLVNAEYVQGYTRSNGTYVQGYSRSAPNQFKFDNYSSQGNTNPFTGNRGYQRNEYSNQPSFNKRSSRYNRGGYRR